MAAKRRGDPTVAKTAVFAASSNQPKYRHSEPSEMHSMHHVRAENADALDRAIARALKATDNIEPILGVTHHSTDVDVARFAH